MEPRAEYRTGRDIQIEHGNFTQIHNDILDALARSALNPNEWCLLMHIFRQTYGWQKKSDEISYGQFSEHTGLPRRSVIRSLQNLIDRNIIYSVDNGDNRPKTWGLNKYIEQWADGVIRVTSDAGDTRTSDAGDTRTSDAGDTRTSDAGDTHKIKNKEKKERGKKAPRLTPQEHTLKKAAMTALNAELPAKERVPYVDPIAKYVGMSKLIETDDQALAKVHRSAIKIHGMGATVQDLRDWWHDWKRDYRSKGASLAQFEKFVSEQLEKHVPDAVITHEEPVFMGAAAPDPWTVQL